MTSLATWAAPCTSCGRDEGGWSRCRACAGVRAADGAAAPGAGVGVGVWRHRAWLPPVETEVSLGEGGTPLLRCDRSAARAGVSRLWVKNECVNPTLSFKDRAMALGVSLALDAGARGVVAASTGNTASSAASYAARAGLPCRVVCAESAAGGPKLAAAAAAGARVEPVAGDFSTAYAVATRSEADGWYPLTTTFRNPWITAAHRGVAVELVEHAERTGAAVPDWVVVPVGAGPLLVGIHDGFRALLAAGRLSRLPRLVAVQAAACAPLAAAWRDGAESVTALPAGHTVAEAIADPMRGYEDEGALTLAAVRDSGGTVVAVPDADIVAARDDLARDEGLLVEPAAAAPLAALRRLLADGTVPASGDVVLVATGHGAKEPAGGDR
ncbi:MAG: pyridoxal-phosphate dependent enzyme [Streptosporangiales bacterium]|nr:pyridoxal-phosphate dependent enzyme [Streptosporangiales bacterium]